jgi:hypothetical protein
MSEPCEPAVTRPYAPSRGGAEPGTTRGMLGAVTFTKPVARMSRAVAQFGTTKK